MSNLKNPAAKTAANSGCACGCETCSCGCPKDACRCQENNCQCGCRKSAAGR